MHDDLGEIKVFLEVWVVCMQPSEDLMQRVQTFLLWVFLLQDEGGDGDLQLAKLG